MFKHVLTQQCQYHNAVCLSVFKAWPYRAFKTRHNIFFSNSKEILENENTAWDIKFLCKSRFIWVEFTLHFKFSSSLLSHQILSTQFIKVINTPSQSCNYNFTLSYTDLVTFTIKWINFP